MKKPLSKPRILGPFVIPAVCLVVNTLVITTILLLMKSIPPEVPLYYGEPQGEEQLATSAALAIPPLLAIFITALNTLIVRFMKEDFLQNVLLGITVMVTILSTVTVFKIIFLVGSF